MKNQNGSQPDQQEDQHIEIYIIESWLNEFWLYLIWQRFECRIQSPSIQKEWFAPKHLNGVVHKDATIDAIACA